jgi:hypothetical protein
MIKVQETTVWSDPIPNHIYFLDDSKTQMFGYIKAGTNEEKWFDGKRGFDSRHRKFDVLAKMANPEQVAATAKQWTVDGSKGASYTVTKDGDNWSCTCPAAVYRKQECKHIVKCKEEK